MTMNRKILFTFIALLLAVSVSAQPPRAREEARRLTNHMDRRVGLTRGQYDQIYRINLRYALREIGPERRDRAYRNVLTPRQWDDYVLRRPHHAPPPPRRVGPGPRRGPGPGYRPGPRRGPGPAARPAPRRDYRPNGGPRNNAPRNNFRGNGPNRNGGNNFRGNGNGPNRNGGGMEATATITAMTATVLTATATMATDRISIDPNSYMQAIA